MLKILHILISCFIAIATVVGSTGLSLHKMACLESGNITLSIDSDFCCASDAEESLPIHSVAAVCCSFDQLDFSVSSFDISSNEVPTFLLPFPVVQSIPSFYSAQFSSLLYEQFIPPLPVGERLALICTYLI